MCVHDRDAAGVLKFTGFMKWLDGIVSQIRSVDSGAVVMFLEGGVTMFERVHSSINKGRRVELNAFSFRLSGPIGPD
jgi:hypothetical protein